MRPPSYRVVMVVAAAVIASAGLAVASCSDPSNTSALHGNAASTSPFPIVITPTKEMDEGAESARVQSEFLDTACEQLFIHSSMAPLRPNNGKGCPRAAADRVDGPQ